MRIESDACTSCELTALGMKPAEHFDADHDAKVQFITDYTNYFYLLYIIIYYILL